jgi:hypothetical protein
MTGHCDADTLAEFRAGLIPGRRGRAIAAHLLDCTECSALDERLAQVSALLAAAPVPAMPDSVIRRLDAVLAAEAEDLRDAQRAVVHHSGPRLLPRVVSRRARPRRDVPRRALPRRAPSPSAPSSSASSRPVSSGSASSGSASSRRALSSRLLAPLAAAVVVLAAAGFGLSQLVQGSSSGPVASGSAALPAGSAAKHPAHARSPMDLNQEYEGAASGAALAIGVVISDMDYQPATLRQQLQSQLAQLNGLRTIPATTSLAACVHRLTGGSAPVLVESARYRGSPVTIVVVSHGADYLAQIAGSACSTTTSDVIATAVLSPGISKP